MIGIAANLNTVDLGPGSVDLSLSRLRLSFLYKPRLCAFHEASHPRSPVLGLAPSEQDRIELLAAKRLAWLWWRATGKTPTCPRRKVQITKSVEGQEYYGPFIDLVRGFFSLANLVKPDSNADQAVRWLPSVIENFSGQQFGNIR